MAGEDLKTLSVHEAGHVVAAIKFGLNLNRCEIGSDGFNFTHVNERKGHWHELEEDGRCAMERYVIYTLSGWAAEHSILNQESTGSNHDFSHALVQLKCLPLPFELGTYHEYRENLKLRAVELVSQHHTEIQRIADELVDKRSLTLDQILAVVSLDITRQDDGCLDPGLRREIG